MRTLSHDPFGRFSVVSRRVPVLTQCCKFCGGVKHAPNGTYLYQYGTERDDRPGRIDWQEGLFCSIGCSRAYNS